MKAEVIYDFSEKSSLRYWSVVDDGVMGGVSQGSLRINYEVWVFSGYVSLENYGGFSSINTTQHQSVLSAMNFYQLKYLVMIKTIKSGSNQIIMIDMYM